MNGNKSPKLVTKDELLADLVRLAKQNPGQPITRRFYRQNGKYGEAQYLAHFGGYGEFVKAAGIGAKPAEQPSAAELQEGITIEGDKMTVFLPKTDIQTLEQLVEHCKIDLVEYEVERWVCNKWAMGYVVGDGKDKYADSLPLFQIKATLKRRKAVTNIKAEIEALKDEAKKLARIPEPILHKPRDSGNMLEINIPDLHIGKLAWSKETGYGNYDTNIAIDLFRTALDTLLSRVSGYTFDSILFVTGNDLLHSDDAEGRTTSGTYVDVDGRYHKTFIKARNLLIETVEKLRRIAPVKVVSCPGNHDTLAAWHLADSLECYFHNYKDVTVDNAPTPRKYHQHGNVMLMFTHGNGGKRADYPLLMASEQAAMWGDTKYREAHTGHIHQTKTEELHGVRVRVLPALCETDAWHSSNAFVGNLRTAEAYVWNKDEGLVTQAFYNAD